MPLPPALAARLAKRGLLKTKEDELEHVEEVIAEDYDDPFSTKQNNSSEDTLSLKASEKEEDSKDKTVIYEIANCPNTTNPYHKCCDYCLNRWGAKKFEPDPEMIKKKEMLLEKYPLPPEWVEVADPSMGRFYYWDVLTDLVSWLPPLHPKAHVTHPADIIKASKAAAMEAREKENKDRLVSNLDRDRSKDRYKGGRKRRDSQGESSQSDNSDNDMNDGENIDRDTNKQVNGDDYRGRSIREQRAKERRRRRDGLDPMDPAAYSDVPRGDWSTGLDQRGSAKTGVDVTASGPLFQQRPYPSPGAVLRINKGGPKDK